MLTTTSTIAASIAGAKPGHAIGLITLLTGEPLRRFKPPRRRRPIYPIGPGVITKPGALYH